MKIRKSTLTTFIILLGSCLFVLSCSKTESESIQQGSLHTISLTSPQGYQIAASTEELKNEIVNHFAEFKSTENSQPPNITLTNITYYKVTVGVCALVSFIKDGKISNILIGKGKLPTLTGNINGHMQTSNSNSRATVMMLPTDENCVSYSANCSGTDCCTVIGTMQTNGIIPFTSSNTGSILNNRTKNISMP